MLTEDVAKEPTTEELIEQAKQRRAARKSSLLSDRTGQVLKDMLELERLELEHGTEKVVPYEVEAKHFSPGLPTMVICSKLGTKNAERFARQMKNHKDDSTQILKIFEAITTQTLLYPSPDMVWKMEDASPGLMAMVGIEVQDQSLCKIKDEKKS